MRMLILSYTIQVVIPYVCIKFRNPRCSSSCREIFDTPFPLHYTGVRDGKKVKKFKRNFSLFLWFSFTQDTSTVCRYIPNLKTLALLRTEKPVIKTFIGEKEKWQIEGMISMRTLILPYTIHEVVPNVYTKFQNHKCSSY